MNKPEECEHFTVRRIIDEWHCLECGLEFVPRKEKPKEKKKRDNP